MAEAGVAPVWAITPEGYWLADDSELVWTAPPGIEGGGAHGAAVTACPNEECDGTIVRAALQGHRVGDEIVSWSGHHECGARVRIFND